MNTPSHLNCTKCLEILPIESFSKSSQSGKVRFGKQYQCRVCMNKSSNSYYKANYVPKIKVKKDATLNISETDFNDSWESVYLSEVSRYYKPF